MSQTSSWSDTDVIAVTLKIKKLRENEKEKENNLGVMRDLIRNLKLLEDSDSKDIDGQVLTNTRRMALKSALFTQADSILPSA